MTSRPQPSPASTQPSITAGDLYEYQQSRIANIKTRAKQKKDSLPSHYNIVICGDYGVGKTSLIQTFCGHTIPGTDPHSVHWTKIKNISGRECAFHLIEAWNSAITGCDEIWGVMGRFRDMDAMDALILVYDPTSRSSFTSLHDVFTLLVGIPDLQNSVPVSLIATKSDVPQSQYEVTIEDGEAFAKEIGAGWFACLSGAFVGEGEDVGEEESHDVDEWERQRTKQGMWNAMKEPAEWRVLAEMEEDEKREERIGDVLGRLAKAANETERRGGMVDGFLERVKDRKGNNGKSKGAAWRSRNIGSTRIQGHDGKRKADGRNSIMMDFFRLPTTVPTVDMAWDEWILGGRYQKINTS
ncbi:putative small G-protein Ras2 [Zalerion maritima]|uniref:Small G-protein Ras2 n=1 Tax=Zalerion maritima TaxID=339359 RepID=A0AAD5RMY9_9PEZI|nr:putative small G-protein Ras2 [Zalerion maritima]